MKTLLTSLLAASALAGSAFAQEQNTGDVADIEATGTATLQGDGIEGTVTLTETPSGVLLIEAEASGLPEGAHGFHLHQTGECNAEENFKSAGGHIAGDADHGIMSENGPHPGDMPNVYVQSDGVLHVEYFAENISLSGAEGATLMDDDGSAIVIHSGADDYTTDPAGDSGDRIACGVIEQAT